MAGFHQHTHQAVLEATGDHVSWADVAQPRTQLVSQRKPASRMHGKGYRGSPRAERERQDRKMDSAPVGSTLRGMRAAE